MPPRLSRVQRAGYELAHHGEGRWNGVAIASRCGIDGVVTNFGEPLRPARTPEAGDDEPLAEARMIAAECGGVRVVACTRRTAAVVGSPFYEAKLVWFDRLARWLNEARSPGHTRRDRRRFQCRARRHRCVGPARLPRRDTRFPARAAKRCPALRAGLVDAYRLHHPEAGRYTWWDYRAGNFHKNFGMRIDHLLVTAPLTPRRLGRDRSRGAEGKAYPLGSCAAGDRHRQPGLSVRCWLGLSRFANCGALTEALAIRNPR